MVQEKTTYIGTGRRKSSIARVRLIYGSGKFFINNIPGESYLQFNPKYIDASKSSLVNLGLENNYDIYVNSYGGGLTGQSDAISLGVARALCQISTDNRKILKPNGLLTRDARIKERKKFGLHKARKAPQYSKR
jgi:small subunit ribosomal protein S9